MYKMYNNQFVDESDDDKNSLNSSFWSDGEREADEEEDEEKVEHKVEVERVISDEGSKLVVTAEESLQEASGEEKPEQDEDNSSGESLEGGSDEDEDDEEDDEEDDDEEEEGEVGETEEGEAEGEEDEEEQGQSGEAEEEEEEDEKAGEEEEEEEEEENCSSSCDSPAPSQMTSGYGTYRPEEQEGGDYRDDHTITEFDQDSRGDLSETKEDEEDEEDDRSLCSFSGFDIEPMELDYSRTRPLSVSEDPEPEASVMCCDDDDGLHEEVNITHTKPEDDEDQADEERFEDLHAVCENEVTNATAEEQQHVAVFEDRLLLDEKHLDGDCVDVDGLKHHERAEEEKEEETQNLKEPEDKVESDPDESSSNKDIKFIDSQVKFSQTSFDKMCEEWEGNLRPKEGKTIPVTQLEIFMLSVCFTCHYQEVIRKTKIEKFLLFSDVFMKRLCVPPTFTVRSTKILIHVQ